MHFEEQSILFIRLTVEFLEKMMNIINSSIFIDKNISIETSMFLQQPINECISETVKLFMWYYISFSLLFLVCSLWWTNSNNKKSREKKTNIFNVNVLHRMARIIMVYRTSIDTIKVLNAVTERWIEILC